MPAHYIKILDWVREWAAQVAKLPVEGWERAIFDDLVGGDGELVFERSPPNHRGPLIELYGQQFACQAGCDATRSDTLFLIRVESADRRLPSPAARRYPGEFLLSTGTLRPQRELDSIAELMGIRDADRSHEGDGGGRSSPLVDLERELGALLAAVPAELRDRWRPSVHPAQGGGRDMLEVAGVLWRNHGLHAHAEPRHRTRAMLQGRLRPSSLKERDRRSILEVFGLRTLNSVARVGGDAARFHRLLEGLAELPLPPAERARVWIAMCAGASPGELRRQLRRLARESRVVGVDPRWGEGLLAGLSQFAIAAGDELLQEQIDAASMSDSPVDALLAWAGRLQFATETTPEPLLALTVSQPELTPVRLGSHDSEPESEPVGSQRAAGWTAAPDEPDGSDTLAEEAPEPAGAAQEAAGVGGLADEWVQALRFGPGDPTVALRKSLDEATRELSVVPSGLTGLDGWLHLQARVESAQAALALLLADFPPPGEIEEERQAAADAMEALVGLLGGEAAQVLRTSIRPRDVVDVLRVLEAPGGLEHAPDWIWAWSEVGLDGVELSVAGRQLFALADPEFRGRLQSCSELVVASGLDPEQVWARVQEVERDQWSELEVELELALEHLRAVNEVPLQHQAWVAAVAEAGAQQDAIAAMIERLDELESKVAPDVYAALLAELCSSDGVPPMERVVRWCIGVDGASRWVDSRSLNLEQIRQAAAQASITSTDSLVPIVNRVVLEQVRVDESGLKVPLCWSRPAGSQLPYGHIEVPFQLRAEQRLEDNLLLTIETKGLGREAWPTDWESPSPRRLRPSRRAWTQVDGGWVLPFDVVIPCREPKKERRRAEVILKVSREGRPDEFLDEQTFAWETVDKWGTDLAVDWPDRIDIESVERHPVGPQQKVEEILSRASGGSSFAVVAPRRFGKSTLVKYLEQRAAGRSLALPEIHVCTEYSNGRSLDYERFWRDLSDSLQKRLGSGISLELSDGLPGKGAFDHVRRSAAAAKMRAVVVLLDEAQLFFPIRDGGAFGSRLKRLLEYHWSSPSEEGLVPVVFGFVGLPSLRERAGNDLLGLVRPLDFHKFTERELNRLVLRATANVLHTTRTCREVLRERSRNLFLLKLLLDQLVERANRVRRTWVGRADIEEVEAELRAKLERNEAIDVGQYLRDDLNSAFDVSQWRPRPAFATAVALASAARDGARTHDERLRRARLLLNEWCERVEAEGRARSVYSPERVQEHVATLTELALYEPARGLTSPLFAAWLVGLSKRFPVGETQCEALLQGALQRIRIPDGLEPVGGGNQAKVFRYVEPGGRQMALRRIPLPTPEARGRFMESVEMLTELRNGALRHRAGAEMLYSLRHIGLSSDADEDQPEGIEIYDWIDGVPLDERLGRLGASSVAFLGAHLARGVALLHRSHVLHRDIQPDNIILAEESGRPVLIDFGLARGTHHAMGTALASPNAAPEVRAIEPNWTPAADIFALGDTLRRLLAPNEQDPKLAELIRQCAEADPANRPTAEQLGDRLERIAVDLKVAERGQGLWERVQAATRDDLEKRWFAGVVEKFRPRFLQLGIGLHTRVFDRAVEAAGFVDQVLEAYPTGAPRGLKLGLVKNSNDQTGDALAHPEVALLHKLRLHRSHSGRKHTEDAVLRSAGRPSDGTLIEMVTAGAQRIGDHLQIPSLGQAVRELMQP